MKKPSKTNLTNRLDKLCSEIVRSKGACIRCGKQDALQCCHIFSRKNRSTRFLLDNLLCMCAGCHFWAHANPLLFGEFVKEYLGELKYEELKVTARGIKKWSVEELIAYYDFLQHYKEEQWEK